MTSPAPSLIGFDAWARLAGDSPTSQTEWSAVVAAWTEPHRRYHDLAHLVAVLRRVDELAEEAEDVDPVQLAAWFHDAVYDPMRSDNEAASAALAEDLLAQLGVEPGVVAEVSRLVRMTASHVVEAEDDNGAVLVDADLAILAADDDAYAAYVDGVRAEFGHLDDTTFAHGRAQVLRGLLARQPLFATPSGRRRWEQRARTNMANELARYEVAP